MRIPGITTRPKLALIVLMVAVGVISQGVLSTTPCVSGQTVPPGWADFEQELEQWAAEQEAELEYQGDARAASLDDLEWWPWLVAIPAEAIPVVGGIVRMPDEGALAGLEVPCP